MRKVAGIVLIAVALCAFTGKSPFFEGIIVYSIKVEAKDPLLKPDGFSKITGTELKIYVKGPSIRAACNGTSGSSGLVTTKGNHNKISSLTMGNDAAAIFLKESTLFAVKPKTEETILGKKCKVLSCDVKSDYPDAYTRKDYYLCETLKMDETPFKGNPSTLSIYKALENGNLPLKMIFEGAAYKVTYVATAIQEKELNPTLLQPDQH